MQPDHEKEALKVGSIKVSKISRYNGCVEDSLNLESLHLESHQVPEHQSSISRHRADGARIGLVALVVAELAHLGGRRTVTAEDVPGSGGLY